MTEIYFSLRIQPCYSAKKIGINKQSHGSIYKYKYNTNISIIS